MTTTSARHSAAHPGLLASAVRLQPLLRRNAIASEPMRRLPDEVVEGLTDAGFFRLGKPHQFGGYEVSQRSVLAAIETLARVNGPAAWLVSLGATAACVVRHGSRQVQSEIFSSLDACIVCSLTRGTARRVEGGLSVSGSWPYSLGAPHADWVTVCAAVPNEALRDAGPYVCFVPASDLQLRDTRRGAAGQTLVAKATFVPQHRTITLSALANGTTPIGDPGRQLPLSPLAAVLAVGPLLGLGQAAAQCVVETARSRSRPKPGNPSLCVGDSADPLIQAAAAESKLRTARLHAFQVADALDAGTVVGGDAGLPPRTQARARCGYAAHHILAAIHDLVNTHATAGLADARLMQKFRRDASVIARHAALNSYIGYEVFGNLQLGVPERIPPLG